MDIVKYFKEALIRNASDLHLVGGNKPAVRINGELEVIDDAVIDSGELTTAIYALLSKDDIANFEQHKELDVALTVAGGQFRVNVHRQESQIGVTARVVPLDIPSPLDIDASETLYKLSHITDGLILVTGPSGSGKSTTLAVLLDMINQERKAHIVTIEDPIEFVFKEKRSIIEQRELGRDTYSFEEALKRALRQDPNVIMVGEMRDRETISATLTAAETGHLVLSTLHTNTAAETVQRIIDMFPADRHNQITSLLASQLRAVICQQLVPRADGSGLVAAREILINTPAIANLIRERKISQIESAIQTSASEGMITMRAALKKLHKDGIIDDQVFSNRVSNSESLASYY